MNLAAQAKLAIDARFPRVVLGPPGPIALCGRRFVTVTSGGVPDGEGSSAPRSPDRDTEDTALLALLSELNIWLADLEGDTVYWRVPPHAEFSHDTKKWRARCRLMVGNQVEEPAAASHDGVIVEKAPRKHMGAERAPQPETVSFDDATAKPAPIADQLPLYRCHKMVRAAKVIDLSSGGQWMLEGGAVVMPADETRRRHAGQPEGPIGGYLVQYEDGYQSWSPAKAFEEGYTLLTGTSPMADAVLSFQGMAGAAYLAGWPKDEKHTRLQRLCRRMAEREGQDPDMMVMGTGGVPPCRGPNDSIVLRFPLCPAWASYICKVEDVLSLLDEKTEGAA